MHVFLADICDTAYVKDMEDEDLVALCDYINEAKKTKRNGVLTLRWTKKPYRARKPSILLITKVWVTPFGVRKIRIQYHKINSDGRIGTREILEERHQGRIVR